MQVNLWVFSEVKGKGYLWREHQWCGASRRYEHFLSNWRRSGKLSPS